MSKVKFSNELLNAFTIVRDHEDNGLQAMRDVASWLKEKVKLDEQYAAGLKKLCATKPGAGMFTKTPAITTETKTLQASVQALADQTAAIANAQLVMAQKVNEQVIKVIDEFVKKAEADKKKTATDGTKFEAALSGDVAAAKKAKAAYEEAAKAAEKLHQEATKATASAGGDDKKKKAAAELTKKAEAAKAKGKQAEDAAKAAVEKANDTRKKFVSEQMPSILDGMQKLHTDRWNELLTVLKFYASALGALPGAIEESVSKLKEQFDTNASLDEDLQEFVDDAKSKAGAAASTEPLTFDVHSFYAGSESSSTTTTPAASSATATTTTTTPAAAATTPAPAATATATSTPAVVEEKKDAPPL